MKKLLLSVMTIASALSINAAEAFIDFPATIGPGTADGNYADGKNNMALTTHEIEGFTFTFAKNDGSSAPAYYSYINKSSGKDEGTVRMYSGNSMQIVAPEGATITAIEMTLGGGTWNHVDSDAGIEVTAGTFSAGFEASTLPSTASWAGSASDLTVTLKNAKNAANKWPQFRIMNMTITYSAGEVTKCATPKFSVKEGTYYTPQTVEISASTEGSAVYYSINGGAETAYTAPIELAEVGTYAISAVAKKDGLESSDAATLNVTIAAPVEVASIAEFIMNGESDATPVYKWTFPVTVTAQMPGNLFVVDADGDAMLIYGNEVPSYNVGDVIPAGIMGEYKNYNGVYELQYPVAASFAASTGNVGFTPADMTCSQITADDVNKVIFIRNATYAETTDDAGKVTAKQMTDNTGSVNVFYQSKWNVENGVSGQVYNLHCVVSAYKGTVQVNPIKFYEPSSVGAINVANANVRAAKGAIEVAGNGNAVVFNAAGQVVAAQHVNGNASIRVAEGFYLVRLGNTVTKVIVK